MIKGITNKRIPLIKGDNNLKSNPHVLQLALTVQNHIKGYELIYIPSV
jgi:hypothetical protein